MSLFRTLIAFILASAVFPGCCAEEQTIETYDVIVVGGGAAGCSAAWHFIQNKYSVLVLERGKSNRDVPQTQHLSSWPSVVNSDATESFRFSEGVWGAVGEVLGGGTSVNDALFIEETPDYFEELLGPSADLTEVYKSYSAIADELMRPENVSDMGKVWAEALVQSGLGPLHGSSRQRLNGTWFPYTGFSSESSGRVRHSAAELLHRAEKTAYGRYLNVKTETLAHKIEIDESDDTPRAIGVWVQYRQGCTRFLPCLWPRRLIRATKAIILAAGAIATPKLLMVSGIGPRTSLEKQGVKVVSENSFVGGNFIDRQLLSLMVPLKADVALMGVQAVAGDPKAGLFFEATAGGHIVSELGKASVGFTSAESRSFVMKEFMSAVFANPAHNEITKFLNQAVELVALHSAPLSRGRVLLNDTDMASSPAVQAGYFTHPTDMATQVQAFEKLLSIIDSQSLKDVSKRKFDMKLKRLPRVLKFLSCLVEDRSSQVESVVLPCLPQNRSAEALHTWLREKMLSSYHYFGTAAMGKVVRPHDFSVIGVQGLHVVDSAVLPVPPRINPMGTVMALGNYAAKRIIASFSPSDAIIV
eukprot:TRINITY_DN7859_c0_g1_i1.p1 TRINITY_DN7859_c0_g1~~TRINITY_DN7859_c0_g1_i1.p1  ORF type:complete len:586 (-),score=69.50 TRINITY_DN7859_c0_g1_i1:191-1948(-)